MYRKRAYGRERMQSRKEIDTSRRACRRDIQRVYAMDYLKNKGHYDNRLREAVEKLYLCIDKAKEYRAGQGCRDEVLEQYRRRMLAYKIRLAEFNIDVLANLIIQDLKLD